LDSTAILLAHQVGILEMVEEEFSPLLVSPHSISLLHAIADAISPHQPSVLNATRMVLTLAEEGKIEVVENQEGGDEPATEGESDRAETEDSPTKIDWRCSLVANIDAPETTGDDSRRNLSRLVAADALVAALGRRHLAEPEELVKG
jgi:hypothetical protein